MIRRLAACTAAAVVALATSSSAAPLQISDAKGDWHVPTQDILAASLSTDRSGRVVATMKLAAALGDVPGTYHFVFYKNGCDSFVATLEWRGPKVPHTSELELSTWCGGYLVPNQVADPRPAPKETVAAPATVTGDTIAWTLPARPELAKGAVLKWPVALAAPNPEGLVGFWMVGTHTPPVVVNAYDAAYGSGQYVVGSR